MKIETKRNDRGIEVTLTQNIRVELDENITEPANTYVEENHMTGERIQVIRINPNKVFVLKEL